MGKARQGDAERYGMSGSAMSSQQDEARLGHDKQLLVQHTLHQYQRAGGKVAGLPIGFDSIQELQQWATDSIDVRQLLKLIADRRPVYLDQLYTASHSLVGNGAGQKAAAVHRVWPERPAAAPAGAAAPVGPAAPEEELPELRLEALETDVDTDSLQEFAFLVFCACCGEVCSPGLLHSVRQQLCISQQQGEALLQSLGHVGVVPDATVLGAAGMRGRAGAASPDLISVTEVQASWDRSAAASLQLPLHLLRSLLPTSFHRFQQYARVRDMLLAVLVNSLVRQLLRSSSSGGSGTGPGSDALIELLEPEPVGGRPEARVRLSVKGSVAQLRGLARRLAVPDADEYEELEHRAAVAELEQSVKAACELLSSSGSGMVLPWALRVRLAEILLRGIFDTLDAGRYIDDKDEFLELLTTMLWPVLRISPELHEACLAWAHFRQLASSGDTRLIPATQDHLQSLILPKDAAAAPNQPSAPSEETRLRQQVGLVAVIWLRQRMEDYHSSFPAAAGLDSMAALYMFALQLQGRSSSAQRDSSPLEELEAAVRSSVAAVVQRSWRAAEAASTGSEQGLLAFFDAVREMLEMEVEQFAPVLRTQLPLACSCALATAHAEVGLRYQAWLVAFKTLRPEAAEVLREAHELELWMAQEMDQDAAAAGVSDPPPGCILDQPWLTLRRAEPVVHHWVLTQNQALSQWLYRLLDQESWKPCNARMQTASIVELLRLAHEALRSLISFDLPLSLSVVRAMVEGLDGVLGSFAERASAQLPDPSIMVPPLPLLTRFKQRLALRGEQAEHRAGGGTGGTGGAAASGAGSGASFMEDGVLPVEMEECYPQVHPLDPEALTTLLCTLHALTEGLDGLRKEVREYVGASSNPFEATPKAGRGGPAVQRLHAADGPSSSGSGAAAWMDGLLEGAQQASVAAAEQVARFAAVKMVFWDLRQLWLWELYRYRVSTTRMGQVGLLRALDACLTQQVGDLPDAVRDWTALQILRATCVILLRILLDGGPARLFVPDDVALIEQDLLALQELFVGGGDGLEAAVVQQVLEPVREVLAVMGLDTGLLIANFDEAAKSAPRKAANGVLQDAEMLKKMLSHRADRAASKFLKQEFKLPKRADGDNPIGRLLKTGAAAGRHGLG